MPIPSVINLNDTTPAAPSGKQNVKWQADTNNPRNVSAYPLGATTSLEGTVKLANDLGGTADTPEVVGIQNVPFGNSPANGYIPTYSSASSQILWKAGGSVGSLAPWNNMLAPSSVTPPVLGSLTWGNQGPATATANAGGALYVFSSSTTSDNLRFLYKAAPATPWTFVIGVVGNITFANMLAGILLRESSSGKLISWGIGPNSVSTQAGAAVSKWSSYTGFSASYISVGNTIFPPISWLSAEDDGTNLSWSCSIDGQNFRRILQEPRGDWFTSHPDQVGIGIDAYGGANADAVFVHWAGV